MEVTRAEVELANEQQRLIVAANDQARTRLELLRAMGRPLDVAIPAEEGLALAEKELSQARKRYEAGVAESLEVTDARTRLTRARENWCRRCIVTIWRGLSSEAIGTILQIGG